MKRFLPPTAAALLGLVPAFALAAAVTIDVKLNGPGVLPNGLPDNAPLRAAGALFILSPLMWVVLIAYFAGISRVLHRFGADSLAGMIFVGLVIATVLAGLSAVQDFRRFGSADAFRSFSMMGLFVFSSLAFGSFGWCAATRRLTGDWSRRRSASLGGFER